MPQKSFSLTDMPKTLGGTPHKVATTKRSICAVILKINHCHFY